MVLIFGAAYAGKRDVAQKFYSVSDFCDGADMPFPQILQASALIHFHTLVRRLLEAGQSPQDFTRRLIAGQPDLLVITDDIGSGIVPLDRSERLWREENGICTRLLAEKSDTVIRVVCGIPQVLKGELP